MKTIKTTFKKVIINITLKIKIIYNKIINKESEKERIKNLWENSKKTQNTIKEYHNSNNIKYTATQHIPKILLTKDKKISEIKQPKDYYFVGVKKEYIIVKEELEFYLKLKRITDKYGFSIFPFMRVADIIKTKDNSIEFNKICRRHIDFTIVDKYTKPVLYIELDGSSHNRWKQKIRDQKKDYIFKTINETIYRIKLNEVNEKLIEIEEYLKYICNKTNYYLVNKNYS